MVSQTVVANVQAFAAIATTGLAALLAFVSFLSYKRLKNKRALFIGSGFVAFALKGVYLIVLAERIRGAETWVLWVALFDLAILLLLYLAIRSR